MEKILRSFSPFVFLEAKIHGMVALLGAIGLGLALIALPLISGAGDSSDTARDEVMRALAADINSCVGKSLGSATVIVDGRPYTGAVPEGAVPIMVLALPNPAARGQEAADPILVSYYRSGEEVLRQEIDPTRAADDTRNQARRIAAGIGDLALSQILSKGQLMTASGVAALTPRTTRAIETAASSTAISHLPTAR